MFIFVNLIQNTSILNLYHIQLLRVRGANLNYLKELSFFRLRQQLQCGFLSFERGDGRRAGEGVGIKYLLDK